MSLWSRLRIGIGMALLAATGAAAQQPHVEITLEATAASSFRAPATEIARNQLRVVLNVSPKRTLSYQTFWNGELQRSVEGQWREGQAGASAATRSIGAWKIKPNNRIEYDGRIVTNLGSTTRLRYVVTIAGESCSAAMNASNASRDGLSRAKFADGSEAIVDRRWYENVSCRIASR